jgi:hypothetical protein
MCTALHDQQGRAYGGRAEGCPPAMYDKVTVRKGAYVPPSLLALFLDGFSTIQHAIVAVDARLTKQSKRGRLPSLA